MKLHRVQQEQDVALPLDTVFGFFSNPKNVQKLTPPSMKMVTLTPGPILMHQGAMIDYVVTVNGLPIRWTAYIADFDPPRRFTDIQLRGPYSYWHHTHTFEDGGATTRIRDEVVYALPFGPLGALAHVLFVKRQIKTIFAYRKQYLEGPIEW